MAHFWNPGHLMPLVEVVPGKDTAPEVVDTTFDLMASIRQKACENQKGIFGIRGQPYATGAVARGVQHHQ